LEIIKSENDLIDYRNQFRNLSFIPTMGNLHKGHLSLLLKAQEYKDPTIVSIYVNPLQFNDSFDFITYPKTLDLDISLLAKNGCDCLFIPDQSILEDINQIKAPKKSIELCGRNRPGHFDGVLTIVNRLFELVKPTRAIFGMKDYQQLALIKDFVYEGKLPITVIGAPTLRDLNGLALSSRNTHLSNDEKLIASLLFKTLQDLAGIHIITDKLINNKIDELSASGFEVDYLKCCNADTLKESSNYSERPLLIAIAAKIKNIRLIDNILVI